MLLEQLEELEHYVKPAEVVNRLSIKPMVRLAASHGAAGKKWYPCKSSWRRQHVSIYLSFSRVVANADYYTLCAERGVNS